MEEARGDLWKSADATVAKVRNDLSGGISQIQECNLVQTDTCPSAPEAYLVTVTRSKNAPSSVTALILGVSDRTIRRWKPENLKQKRLSQEEVQKIQELKEEGKTQREIAEEIGVAQQAIDYQLTKNDKCPILSDSPATLEPDDDKALPICPSWTDGTTISILPSWQDTRT